MSDPAPFIEEVHNFEADTENGTEECTRCGTILQSSYHPHAFTIDRNPRTCKCGMPERVTVHQMTSV